MNARVDVDHRACFHCGLPVADDTFGISVEGVSHATCCRGCQAVAQTILDSGLGAYYRTRAALPAPPRPEDDVPQALGVYDFPEVQRGFVRTDASHPHEREAAVLLERITCAACVWLIERSVSQQPGVLGIEVNYAARRARVRWDERETRLSSIIAAIVALGYGAQPYDSARADDALRSERKSLLWRLFVAGFSMMQAMMYAIPVYVAADAMTADIEQLMRIAGLILTAPVVAWAATPFYAGAWREIARGRVGMDVPVAAGILIAFVASAGATVAAAGAVYFDSVSMFVFLLLGARYLELGARTRAAAEQDRLVRLAPATAERLDRFPDPRRTEQVAAAVLAPGDFVLVRPGAAIPADAVVVDGESSADEALLTGESRAVRKARGDRVLGGSFNRASPLVVRVDRPSAESFLSGVVRLIDRAQGEKPRIAIAADRAARAFSGMVLVIAFAAAAAWYLIDPERALWITVAVLVVSCPCALSLATPAVLTAATGGLYREGVLVTRGHAIETLARATHFVFDKTGTLTDGSMRLVGVLPLGALDPAACVRLAAALESRSEHPIAKAVLEAEDGRADACSEVRSVSGSGMEGIVAGARLRIGRPDFVAALSGSALPDVLALISDRVSAVALGNEQGLIALLTFEEKLRPDARRVVFELERCGKKVALLSGDRRARVERLARDLGVTRVCAEATPELKVEFVRNLQGAGAVVAMIGDGVNDAPVLAQAQVSVALASGAELAQVSADIVLLSEHLGAFIRAHRHARFALRVIRQNLAWATAYNACALPLAAAGLVTPLAAAAGMSLSSVLVVANALRLVRTERDSSGSATRHASTAGLRAALT